MQTVDLRGHCIYNSLAVRGAIVEEQVQHCVIAELTQAADAGQCDSLNVSIVDQSKQE